MTDDKKNIRRLIYNHRQGNSEDLLKFLKDTKKLPKSIEDSVFNEINYSPSAESAQIAAYTIGKVTSRSYVVHPKLFAFSESSVQDIDFYIDTYTKLLKEQYEGTNLKMSYLVLTQMFGIHFTDVSSFYRTTVEFLENINGGNTNYILKVLPVVDSVLKKCDDYFSYFCKGALRIESETKGLDKLFYVIENLFELLENKQRPEYYIQHNDKDSIKEKLSNVLSAYHYNKLDSSVEHKDKDTNKRTKL